MATRFYTNYEPRQFQPYTNGPSGFHASWTSVASASPNFNHLLPHKQTANIPAATGSMTPSGVSGLNGCRRLITPPLAAQTISGTIKGQFLCSETAIGNNQKLAVAVRILKPDMTERAVLLAPTGSDSTATPPEFATTLTNRPLQDVNENTSISLTSQSCQEGDRIVVELGIRQESTVTATASWNMNATVDGTDLAENSTATAVANSWIEFSADIALQDTPDYPYSVGYNNVPEGQTPGSNATTTITLAPPGGTSPPANGGMRKGDLCVVICQSRSSATWSVGVTGGQTWTEEVFPISPGMSLFWCTFNGTWTASPRFDSTSGLCTSAAMNCWRALSTGHVWAIDNPLDVDSFAATTTPTRTGVTTTKPNAIVILGAATLDDNSWSTLTSADDWSSFAFTYLPNTAGSDMSMCVRFRILAAAGASGDHTMTQTVNGPDAGETFIISFYPIAPASLTQSARFDDADTFGAAHVSRTLHPSRYDDADSFGAAVVTRGAVTLTQSARFDDPESFQVAIVQGGLTQTARFDDADTFNAHVLTTPVSLTQTARFDDADSFGVAIVTGGLVQSARFDDGDSFGAATVQAVTPLVQSARFDDADAFGAAVVSTGAVTLTQTARFDDADVFGVAVVTRGAVQLIQTARFDDVDAFGAAVVLAVYPLTQSARFDDPDSFGAATLTTSYNAVQAARFDDADAFGVAVVTRGAVSLVQSARFDDADSFGAATVSSGAIALTQTARFDDADSFFAATVRLNLAQAARYDDPDSFGTAVFTVFLTQAARHDDADVFFAPTVSVAAVTLTQTVRFDDADSFGAAALSRNLVQTARLDDADSFGAAVLNLGLFQTAQFVDPDAFGAAVMGFGLTPTNVFADPDVFFAATVSAGASGLVQTARFDDADSFFSALVTTDALTILPPRFDDPDSFGAAAISTTVGVAMAFRPHFNTFGGSTIFDDFFASSQITLAQGGLRATVGPLAAGYYSARASHARTAGKFCFKATALVNGPADLGVGIVSDIFVFGDPDNYVGDATDGLGYFNRAILQNGAVADGLDTDDNFVDGAQVLVAVDLTAQKFWVKRLNGPHSLAWNANPAADPATGVGGISYVGEFSGNIYPAVSIYADGSTVQSGFDLDFLPTGLPSGFSAWDDPVAVALPVYNPVQSARYDDPDVFPVALLTVTPVIQPFFFVEPDVFFAAVITTQVSLAQTTPHVDDDTFFGAAITGDFYATQAARFDDADTFPTAQVNMAAAGAARYDDPDLFGAAAVTSVVFLAQAARYDDADAFGAAVVTRGAVSLVQTARHTDPDAFGAAAITVGPTSVTQAAHYNDPDLFGAASVSAGAWNVGADRFDDPDFFGAAQVGFGLLQAARFNDPDAFGAAVVTRGAVSLTQAVRFDDGDLFGAAAVTTGATPLAQTARFNDPDVFGAAVVAAGAVSVAQGARFDDGDAFGAAIVQRGLFQTARFEDPADQFLPPTVSAGNALFANRFDDPDAFFAAAVLNTKILVETARFNDPDVFFAAAISTGAVGLVQDGRFDDADAFAEAVVGRFLEPGRFDDPDEFGEAEVVAHAVLRPARFDDPDFFGAADLDLVGQVIRRRVYHIGTQRRTDYNSGRTRRTAYPSDR